MSLAGELTIEARWDGRVVRGLDIASTRPQASRLLVGRRPDHAARVVPLLFTLCARAQEAAAFAALEAARAIERDDAQNALHVRRVLIEAIQEHLWRLLLDWPTLCDQPALRDVFVPWHRRAELLLHAADPVDCHAFGSDLLALCDRELLPLRLDEWGELAEPQALLVACGRQGALSPTISALAAIDEGGATSATITLMPDLSAAQLARCLPTVELERFAELPTLDGVPRETGALAQHRTVPLLDGLLASGRRLLARMIARIEALVVCARGLLDNTAAAPTIDAHAAQGGIGVARVMTARGVLLHRVELDGERVARYTIVAPTEWNFHPCGTLAGEWEGRRFDSESGLLLTLRAAVLALDPCVAYRIGVEHA